MRRDLLPGAFRVSVAARSAPPTKQLPGDKDGDALVSDPLPW